MNKTRLTKKVKSYEPDNKRPPGRFTNRWKECLTPTFEEARWN